MGSWGELEKAVGGVGWGSCVWELCPSIVGKVIQGRCARGRNCVGGTVLEKLWGSYVSFMSSQKCSICYSVACSVDVLPRLFL